ncbi:hypothetical protein [Mycobacterium marseillense]|uniref:hypothetical protein n=1 Tax=Mycobacterium marseillense TaxID=701042 RepID=UPI001041FCD8|nr:hypothetical protein [Mycobacterium marseillense]MCA2264239.1 hypothetical protein [Mycobacterium marseillense]
MSTDDTAASEYGADAETTEGPPPAADEPELAWSVDDEPDEAQPNRHGRLMWAGLSVLVLAVGGALVLLASFLFGWHTTNNARPQPVPSPPVTTTVAAAPPRPTVAAPPPPPAATSTPGPSVYDQNFLNLMAQEGWGCTDNSDAETCKKEMVSFAHVACSYSGLDYSTVYQNMAPYTWGRSAFISPARETRRALALAQQAYPNCTFTGSP